MINASYCIWHATGFIDREPSTYHEPVLHCALADPQARHTWGLLSEDSLDRSIELRCIHLLASHIELNPVLLHEKSDVFPVSHSQIRFLDGHDLLLVFSGKNYVQSIGFPVGNDFEDGSGAIFLLHGQKASSRVFELLEVEQKQKSSLRVDGIDQVPEGALGNRGNQVGVQDLVGGAVRIVAFHQSHPVVFPRHLDELKQIVNAVVVSTFYQEFRS